MLWDALDPLFTPQLHYDYLDSLITHFTFASCLKLCFSIPGHSPMEAGNLLFLGYFCILFHKHANQMAIF